MKTNPLIEIVRKALVWTKTEGKGFPSNPVIRDLRSAEFIDHYGQRLKNMHRSSNQLCDLMAGVVITQRMTNVLEIGTLFGYSTLHLAEAVNEIGGHVDSIDLRVSNRKWGTGEEVHDIHLTAERLLRDAGLDSVVDLISGRSDSIMPSLVLDGRQYDLVFIDGSHSRYVVTLDLINAINLLKPGGVIFLDDVSEGIAVKPFHYGGPNSILPALIGSSQFHIVPLTHNTLVMMHREAVPSIRDLDE